jgi:hypothetical protein
MRLVINHVGRDNWARHAPRSIDRPVSMADVVRAASADVSPEELARLETDLTSMFGEEAYCWALPARAESLFDRMNPGDATLFVSAVSPSQGQGQVECLAYVDYLPREALPETSRLVWGAPHFWWMFFFRERTLLRMGWENLVSDLSYAPDRNPRGWAWAVAEWRVARLGGVHAYMSHIESRYGI